MDLLERIRTESRAIHDRLEGVSGVNRIMDGSVTQEQFQQILRKNYLAFAKAEQQIIQFHEITEPMSSRILADLDQVDFNKEIESEFELTDKYEALGARYVLNGSMLGAAIIGKHLKDCQGVSQKDWQFYRKPHAQERKAWPELLNEITQISYTEDQQKQILTGVMKTFELFEEIYLQNSSNLLPV